MEETMDLLEMRLSNTQKFMELEIEEEDWVLDS